jgi:enoyl-CoA hydratase
VPDLLLTRPAEGVVLITLNRPERLNALEWDTLRLLRDELATLAEDRSVRAAILTGAGRGFCAGLDLQQDETFAPHREKVLDNQELFASTIVEMRELTLPLIAAVNGPAAGGGLALSLACDVRIAAPAARFGAAFVRIGLSGCDMGTSHLLPRIVGYGHASEMLLTGRLVPADEAERIGLVNRVVPAEELLDSALETAGLIAANAPFGVRMTKQVLGVNVDAPSLRAAIELENRTQVLTTGTAEQREALAAFLERRPARFSTNV